MPAIPSIASFTGASVTEGDFKTALSNLHLFLTGLLGTDGTQAGAQAAMGAILGAGSTTKTAAYTVDFTDRGKVIACDGSFTVTLPDASAVGSGFAVAVANYGAGTVTVDPFSAQTIDGATTKMLGANTMLVACAVSGEWLTVGGMTLPTASTGVAGIVQLYGGVDSTSTTMAATASTVKAAYDLAASHIHHDIGYNIVGSLCLAGRITPGESTINPGGTVAGADLRPANASGMLISHPFAGTWRCLGYSISGTGSYILSITLWQRIS